MKHRWSTLSFLVAAGTIAATSPVQAGTVNPARGSYQTDVTFDLPAFRSLTPRLGLQYDSGAGNGVAGVGWTLGGVAYLERVHGQGAALTQVAQGAPRYDDSDRWMLGNLELEACGELPDQSQSASCRSGGTHSPKIESYEKISKDDTGFTVVERDGTVYRYGKVLNGPSGLPFRYYLSSVKDTNANQVLYTYTADAAYRTLYLSQISYRDVVVKLYYQTRTDVVTSAMGGGGLSTLARRLAFVDVQINDPVQGLLRRSTHALRYATSGFTGRSLLASVRRYGSSATLTCDTGAFPSCTIAGGSPLPAHTFAYLGDDLAAGSKGSFGDETWSDNQVVPAVGQAWAGDFNGDGKTDLAVVSGGNLYVDRSTAAGFVKEQWLASAGTFGVTWVNDFDGDGKSDLATQVGTNIYVYKPSFNGSTWSFQKSQWFFDSESHHAWGYQWTGDFNGDGKADLALSDGTGVIATRISTGTDFVTERLTYTNFYGIQQSTVVSDVDGDGQQELVTGYAGQLIVYRWNGSDFVQVSATGNVSAGSRLFQGDFDGDGKGDVAWGVNGNLKVALSTGNGYVVQSWSTTTTTWAENLADAFDANGDGMTDIVAQTPAGAIVAYVSNGHGFTSAQTWAASGHFNPKVGARWFGDFDGNGRFELATVDEADADRVWVHLAVLPRSHNYILARPDVLQGETTPQGGFFSPAFWPSSAFPSVNNPPVFQVVRSLTASNGVGNAPVTTFDYAGATRRPALHNRFVGFTQVTRTMPRNTYSDARSYDAFAPRTVTTFDLGQSDGWDGVARPAREESWDASGKNVGKVVHTYASTTQLPARAVELQTDHSVGDGNGHWVTVTTTRSYDGTWLGADNRRYWQGSYGLVTGESTYGDKGNGTITHTTVWTDYDTSNAALYIVAQPAWVRTYDGDSNTQIAASHFLYDTRGNLVTEYRWLDHNPDGSANAAGVYVGTSHTYSARGDQLTTTDPLGHVTRLTYDAAGRVTSMRNPLGQDVATEWDTVLDVKKSETLAPGQTFALQTKYSYDVHGRLTQVVSPDGGVSTRAIVAEGDPLNQLEKTSKPGAPGQAAIVTERRFDGFGRTLRTRQVATDACVWSEWDLRDNLSRASEPAACTGTPSLWTSFAYDGLNRLIKKTLPDGKATRTEYTIGTSALNTYVITTTTTDPMGHAVRIDRNAFGQPTRQIEPGGLQTSYVYDHRGLLIRTTPMYGSDFTATYDSMNRRMQDTNPDRGTIKYVYDADGRLIRSTDQLGFVTEMTYDALDRPTKKTFHVGQADQASYSYAYDAVDGANPNRGHLTSYSDPAGSATLTYGKGGQVIRMARFMKEDGKTYTFSSSYDKGGRLLARTFPDGDTLGTTASPITYDAAGRLATVPGVVTSITYDLADRPLTVRNSNNTHTTWTYDAARAWTSTIKAGPYGGTPVLSLAYGRDDDGVIKQTDSFVGSSTTKLAQESWTYTHDALHRLTGASDQITGSNSQAFGYDTGHNLTKVGASVFTYGDPEHPHAVKSALGTSYSYDALGRMLSGGNRTITWGADGLPRQIVSGGVATTYAYDAMGTRVSMKEGSKLATFTLGDDYQVDRQNGVVSKDLRVGGFLLGRRVGSERYWAHVDLLGSVRLLTKADGTVAQRLAYRAYGQPFGSRVGKGFTGADQDATGLVYLHHRYYDPAIGRFISPDPSVPGGRSIALNPYAYGENDPIAVTDHSGLDPRQYIDSTGRYHQMVDVPGTDLTVTVSYGWENGHATGLTITPNQNLDANPLGPIFGTRWELEDVQVDVTRLGDGQTAMEFTMKAIRTVNAEHLLQAATLGDAAEIKYGAEFLAMIAEEKAGVFVGKTLKATAMEKWAGKLLENHVSGYISLVLVAGTDGSLGDAQSTGGAFDDFGFGEYEPEPGPLPPILFNRPVVPLLNIDGSSMFSAYGAITGASSSGGVGTGGGKGGLNFLGGRPHIKGRNSVYVWPLNYIPGSGYSAPSFGDSGGY